MRKNRFPVGWNARKVCKVIAHYEAQSEDEAVAEDEAAIEDRGQTLIEIPRKLVPKVRELLAKHAA